MDNIFNVGSFKLDIKRGLKVVLSENLVIHCHHYNARLQRTIEENKKFDGKSIIRSSTATVIYSMLKNAQEKNPKVEISQLTSDLYSFLGFGRLDMSRIRQGVITSSTSHFVEGWRCGSLKRQGNVCSFTEGFLEAAFKLISGNEQQVEEHECMNEGHTCCVFKLATSENAAKFWDRKVNTIELEVVSLQDQPSNINKEAIIEAVMNMPIHGNNEGLIPAFNVYLANMPQDIYNLICTKYVMAMDQQGLGELATRLLTEDAENCALNTFNGILNSDEWAGLIAPMVKEERDKIFGLVAVANALGWGRINVLEHNDRESLTLMSSNGYEAYGYLTLHGSSHTPKCYMLTGVSAGLMSLIYEKGEIESRTGAYESHEELCVCKEDQNCTFKSKYAS